VTKYLGTQDTWNRVVVDRPAYEVLAEVDPVLEEPKKDGRGDGPSEIKQSAEREPPVQTPATSKLSVVDESTDGDSDDEEHDQYMNKFLLALGWLRFVPKVSFRITPLFFTSMNDVIRRMCLMKYL